MHSFFILKDFKIYSEGVPIWVGKIIVLPPLAAKMLMKQIHNSPRILRRYLLTFNQYTR